MYIRTLLVLMVVLAAQAQPGEPCANIERIGRILDAMPVSQMNSLNPDLMKVADELATELREAKCVNIVKVEMNSREAEKSNWRSKQSTRVAMIAFRTGAVMQLGNIGLGAVGCSPLVRALTFSAKGGILFGAAVLLADSSLGSPLAELIQEGVDILYGRFVEIPSVTQLSAVEARTVALQALLEFKESRIHPQEADAISAPSLLKIMSRLQ